MIAAQARGSALTGSLPWLEAARQAANFISKHLITAEGRLLRSYLIAPASITAFLEDYAFLAWGYLELYQASQNPGDLDQAGSLCSTALELFSSADGRLRTAGSDAEQLPLALPDMHDGVIPGGASVMATNLSRLAEITGSETWKKAAGTLLQSYHANLQQAPVNSLWMLQALAETDQGPGKKPGP